MKTVVELIDGTEEIHEDSSPSYDAECRELAIVDIESSISVIYVKPEEIKKVTFYLTKE